MAKQVLIAVLLLIFVGCSSESKPRYTEEELAQIPHPQRHGLPAPSGGFVLAVGAETITADEIIAPLMRQLGPMAQQLEYDQFTARAAPAVLSVLRERVSDVLLYQQARNAAGEDIEDRLEQAVESEVRRFLMRFGGDYAKAEAFLSDQMGMDWESFRTYQRRMILSSSYLHRQIPEPDPVTYSDMTEYYQQRKEKQYSKDATITIRLIDIDIAKVEPADSNLTSQQQAQALVAELIEELNAGGEFGELAKNYSQGYRASLGGLWKPIKPESLARPYDVLAVQTEHMQVGDIVGPVKTPGHLFIVKLEDRQIGTTVPFEQVQQEIEQKITMDRKQQAFTEVMNKVLEEAAISGLIDFVDFCVQRMYVEANQFTG